MGFADSIRAFEQKALATANSKVTSMVQQLFISVINLTPSPSLRPGKAHYSLGVMSNQWYTGEGKTFNLTNTSAASPYGADSMSRVMSLSMTPLFWGRDNTVTFTNSTKYIRWAEYIGWPKGLGAEGWIWTGKVGAYKMVSTSINNFKGAYS